MSDERPERELTWPPAESAPSWGAAPDDAWPTYQPAGQQSPSQSSAYAPGTEWGEGYSSWGDPSRLPADDQPTTQYPAAQYAAAQYPTTQYPSAQYPGAQYPTAYAGAPYAGAQQAAAPTAEYPTSAYAPVQWGAGSPPAGTRVEERASRRGTGWLPLLLVALLASLIGGGVGAGLTLANDDEPDTQPTATATVTASAPAPTAQAGRSPAPATVREVAPGSIASIADALLESVVEIGVETNSGGGSGSGVVIREDGYILTNNHVVEGAVEIEVRVGLKKVAAKLIGTDPANDLAVIQATGAGPMVPAQLGTVDGLKVGDPVIAIGSPLGLTGTVTSGIVSALNRTVDIPADDSNAREAIYGAIQTDAAINPGNSGGALVDGNGKVIGINTAIASLGRLSGGQAGSIGLGFAIPIDLAKDTADQLIATGKAVHPYIGVSVSTIDEEAAAQLNITQGALVNEISAGGPADKAGLQVDDVITKLSGTAVTSSDQLVRDIRRHKVGEKVSLTYVRRGAERTAELVLAERPPR